MTEIATRDADNQMVPDSGVGRLVEWAQAAKAAHALASSLCQTKFVPTQYQGKPAEATAAILAGAEVGLSPMASLRAFHNIQGTPAPAALTLRAIVQSKGHEVVIRESDATHAVVAGRRRGESEWQTSTWTIERAQQMGLLTKNPNWKSQPAAMLVARATAEVCRWVASDAIMGMGYAAEELEDHAPEPARPRQRVTVAEITGQPVEEPADPADPVSPDTDESWPPVEQPGGAGVAE